MGIDYFSDRDFWNKQAKKIVFTGQIDEFYDYQFGQLAYRSLKFEHEHLDMENYQGNAVVNYTEFDIPYTRIIEHKHFEFGTQSHTVITREYPSEWTKKEEPFYPVNDAKNNKIASQYKDLAKKEENVLFGGRLSEYIYYDMHQVIASALKKAKVELKSLGL